MSKLLYKTHLEELTKKDIEKLLKQFSLLSEVDIKTISRLKKNDEIKLIMASMKEYIQDIIRDFTWQKFDILQEMIDIKKIKKADIDYKFNDIIKILNKYDFIYNEEIKNLTYYHVYEDIAKVFVESFKDKSIKRSVKSEVKKYTLINGIVNAYGAISFDNLFNLIQKEYPKVVKEKLLESINRHLVVNNDFKMADNKGDSILFNKYFNTLKDAQKIVGKDIKAYTYEDYLSFGRRDYKYNNEYKHLMKLIKRKYVFKKQDLKKFNDVILNKYVDMYRIDQKTATAFINQSIKEKFEFKNTDLEEKLMKQLERVAACEPKWEA